MKKTVILLSFLLAVLFAVPKVIDSLPKQKEKALAAAPEKQNFLFLNLANNALEKDSSLAIWATEQALKTAKNRKERFYTLWQKGIILAKLGKAKEAQMLLEAVLSYYQNKNDKETVALIYACLGQCAYGQKRSEEALENYKKALGLMQSLKMSEKMGNILNNISLVYYSRGEYENALKALQKALNIAENIEDRMAVAQTKECMGNVYFKMKMLKEARHCYENALVIYDALEMKMSKASILNALGSVCSDEGNYSKALAYQRDSYFLRVRAKDYAGIIASLNSMGLTHKKQGNLSSALSCYQQAYSLQAKQKNKSEKAIILSNMGFIYDEQQNYAKAVTAYEKSLALADSMKSQDLILTNLKALSNVFNKQGQTHKALETALFYIDIRDSLIAAETKQNLSNLSSKYETERRELEIKKLRREKKINELLLQKRKTERNYFLFLMCIVGLFSLSMLYLYHTKRKALKNLEILHLSLMEANAQIHEQQTTKEVFILKQEKLLQELASLNATRNKFFFIIAHDLKNALNSLRMGAKLMTLDTVNLSRKELVELGEELNLSLDHLHKLLENLLTWAKLQIGRIEQRPEDIVLQAVANTAIELLQTKSQSKKIKINNHIDENIKVHADKNMLASVFQNILSNALKFSHTDSEIEISCTRNFTKWEIKIEDRGIGLSDEDKDKLFRMDINFSLPGTFEERGTGLGLILCREFIEKNNGELWLESVFGKGTTVYFTLPEAIAAG